jgi:hypothetical protein
MLAGVLIVYCPLDASSPTPKPTPDSAQFPPLHDPKSSDIESMLPVPVNTVFWGAAPKVISLGLPPIMVINVDVAAAGNAPKASTAKPNIVRAILFLTIFPPVWSLHRIPSQNAGKNHPPRKELKLFCIQPKIVNFALRS